MKYILSILCASLFSVLPLSVVQAASSTCPTSSLRWAASSNTLYVDGSATVCTPSDLSAFKPAVVVSQGSNTFLAKSNIKMTNGATLKVVGTINGGDTDQLLLMSDNSSTSSSYISIVADWGKVTLDHTKVTSWDESTNAPSTRTTYGRAYLDVRSRLVDGVALQSRMDISKSDVGYLGYDGSEKYGLVWKVEGSTSTDKSVFNTVDVLGNVTDNHLHNNYFGIYTYGAYGMTINNNEVDHNVKYGIDTHDDSDYLSITNNRTHHNGNHGIICSERCDHLIITGNNSYSNIGHGIMLHRSTDYCDVENNTISGNTQAGIALFESNNNTVRNNIITGSAYGIRLSVGSSYNTFDTNTISQSSSYGIYTYQGTDTPQRPGNTGINSYNTWTHNTVSFSARNVMKLNATDHDTFDSNDFRNNSGVGFSLSRATNMTYTNNLTDAGVTLP